MRPVWWKTSYQKLCYYPLVRKCKSLLYSRARLFGSLIGLSYKDLYMARCVHCAGLIANHKMVTIQIASDVRDRRFEPMLYTLIKQNKPKERRQYFDLVVCLDKKDYLFARWVPRMRWSERKGPCPPSQVITWSQLTNDVTHSLTMWSQLTSDVTHSLTMWLQLTNDVTHSLTTCSQLTSDVTHSLTIWSQLICDVTHTLATYSQMIRDITHPAVNANSRTLMSHTLSLKGSAD